MPDPSSNPAHAKESEWYAAARERLVGVVQELSQARSVDAVAAIVREAARSLTGADGASLVLRDGNQCYYADENAIAPLWKGKRFPMKSCVSGWVMEHAAPAVIEDIYADARVPADAYRPTFVKSMAMVPIRRSSPIGAIGNYWADRRTPSAEVVAILQALADTTSVAIENAELYGQLREQVRTLQKQEARIREQRDTIEVFARALAHDLKEPVRTLKAFARLASDETDGEAGRERSLEFVRGAADRMGVLVDSVFRYMQFDEDFGRLEETCDVGRALQAVEQNLAQLMGEKGARIESGGLPSVRMHAGHMVQILQNLIVNAIRHNEKPVTVCIESRAVGDQWEFSVRDNGTGIPPKHAEKIFQPFQRLERNEDCAGMGLAICEKILTRYGGTIRCEADGEGGEGGARFVFSLPRSEGTAAALAASAPVSEPEESGGEGPLACMLLVDDMPADLLLNQMLLVRKAKLKCRILTAEDGEEALKVLGQEKVDLVLLDINMPRINGFEVLERMRRNGTMKDVPVIMCTGSDYEKDKERARALGAAGYILKPPSFEELLTVIESIPALRLQREGEGYSLKCFDAKAA